MEIPSWLLDTVRALLPTGLAIVAVVGGLVLVHLFLEKRSRGVYGARYRQQIIMLVLSNAGLLLVIMVLPVSETTRGQLLGLLGVVLSAAIALSSTTFVGNAMAGIMLRAVRSFGAGDFVRVGDHFGRVSEQGLFHVELQTEDRDLTTLPNLFLVTHPVTVVRASGTIISTTVSLGYDVPRREVTEHLLAAAADAGLEEPFVQILELGDFSLTYRVAGLLKEVKHIISAKSGIRERVLDHLHEAEIEIVSPNFMNTRALADGEKIIPETAPRQAAEPVPSSPKPETIIFDKAEQAESLEELKARFEKATDPDERAHLERLIERLESERESEEKPETRADKMTSQD